MADLLRVEKRSKLAIRRAPHWQELSRGRSLGYRRMSESTPGSWIARIFIDGDYRQKALGDFGTLPEKDRFAAARKAADEFFAHVEGGGSTERVTVKQACAAYVEKLKQEK